MIPARSKVDYWLGLADEEMKEGDVTLTPNPPKQGPETPLLLPLFDFVQ